MSDNNDADVSEEDDAMEALQQAQQFHGALDEIKEWARGTASEMRSEAEVREELDDIDSERADQLRQIAQVIDSLYQRIENGDSNAAKTIQPQESSDD